MSKNKACVMSKLAPLYRELLLICRNGVIPNLKLVSALQKCHANKPIGVRLQKCNADGIDVWAATASCKLRQIAQMWRNMAEDELCFDRCIKEACHRTYRVLGFKA
jgi:hypothetical protein